MQSIMGIIYYTFTNFKVTATNFWSWLCAFRRVTHTRLHNVTDARIILLTGFKTFVCVNRESSCISRKPRDIHKLKICKPDLYIWKPGLDTSQRDLNTRKSRLFTYSTGLFTRKPGLYTRAPGSARKPGFHNENQGFLKTGLYNHKPDLYTTCKLGLKLWNFDQNL